MMITKIKSMIKGKTSYLDMIENGALVVDVRQPKEFALGNIPESVNIPLGLLPNRIEEMTGKTVVLVCQSGGRAMVAKNLLKKKGIDAHNAGSWVNLK